ncbi:hypothetical protein PF005_g30981 [Phytophthora fragariae]|uniref:Uncharacterized protein n=1 Tax=Phytophthora fragariae TaxID=53985 RepID=A0A6A3V6V4_9STRA|nr:hypothetical protein PF003_g33708 [Phytophthora fragariae]KAE8918273.1 hypothetical protein PF009_g31410 [Phytophthora fragariae]KAE8959873.1 hypothetical protein PF011_g30289 [Phytophthora fragariae]KAE9059120.1 hypothetical protein PF010_g30747 [Phytophthora fragariae]KAE9059550.1 hypothetical protein PF007_g30914 [Phytophthora fragariae]
MGTTNAESKSKTNTPASTMKADFAMLESTTPVECAQTHRHVQHDDQMELPSALPMPKIVGPDVSCPPVKRSLLGGSRVHGPLKRPLGNSRRGHSRAREGVHTTRTSFLPSSSALNMGLHPSMSRPSRQLNMAGLNELKEHLWKASISSNDGLKASIDTSTHYSYQGHPEQPLSFGSQ